MNTRHWLHKESVKYTFFGVLFGLLFPVLATLIDLLQNGLSVSFANAMKIQSDNHLHYIIDTAPLFLGLFAYIAGKNLDILKTKNEQIVQASKFKQEFLANMSHEIRTPMVGVIGMIDLLSNNTSLSKLQQEYVEIISNSSQNLLDILNQILDLSKIEAGKVDLNPQVIDFESLIKQVNDLFMANSKAKGLVLQYQFPENLPKYIVADQNRLIQIISNLVGNAIKFTNQGSITVKPSLISKKGKDLKIKIEVIDTGIGISKKDQLALFKRFSQVNENAIIRDGSGLGLTICNKLVQLMNGKLGVESKVGKGSNFWFTFKGKVVDPSVQVSKVKRKKGPQQKFNLKILLVEDSETNILVSTQILKFLGCTADVAKTGIEALEKFKENKYDLILMDINLPELDGVQTTQILRKNYDHLPPIIALTSNALPGDAERFIEKGLDDYITKPYTTETLNIKLANWFGDHSGYH